VAAFGGNLEEFISGELQDLKWLEGFSSSIGTA
jgi:hypothetical protein